MLGATTASRHRKIFTAACFFSHRLLHAHTRHPWVTSTPLGSAVQEAEGEGDPGCRYLSFSAMISLVR